MKRLRPTDEQENIIEAFSRERNLQINAFAGTGKTTTLRLIAEANPDKRILILAFNRSIAEELRRTMPSNVHATTIHSLAYRMLSIRSTANKGDDLELILAKLTDNIDAAMVIKEVFEAFCQSHYTQLSSESVKEILERNWELRYRAYILGLTVDSLVSYIERLWLLFESKVIDPTHYFYQKKFQIYLAKGRYNEYFKHFDAVFLDEAQDVNPVQVGIFLSLPIERKVMVGDVHQSIYGWRGAVNSLSNPAFRYFKRYYLTKSFRFQNDEIVKNANLILQKFKLEEKTISRAGNTKGRKGIIAFITRTNSALIKEALDLKGPMRIGFTRPLQEIFHSLFVAEEVIQHIYGKAPLRRTPPHIKWLIRREKIEDVDQLISRLQELGDIEHSTALKIAKKINVWQAYRELYRRVSDNPVIVFTTAHSSKGLEFDEVILGDDFPLIPSLLKSFCTKREIPIEEGKKKFFEAVSKGYPYASEYIDEINLQYVAITRGIFNVELSASLEINLRYAQNLKIGDLIPEGAHNKEERFLNTHSSREVITDISTLASDEIELKEKILEKLKEGKELYFPKENILLSPSLSPMQLLDGILKLEKAISVSC